MSYDVCNQWTKELSLILVTVPISSCCQHAEWLFACSCVWKHSRLSSARISLKFKLSVSSLFNASTWCDLLRCKVFAEDTVGYVHIDLQHARPDPAQLSWFYAPSFLFLFLSFFFLFLRVHVRMDVEVQERLGRIEFWSNLLTCV